MAEQFEHDGFNSPNEAGFAKTPVAATGRIYKPTAHLRFVKRKEAIRGAGETETVRWVRLLQQWFSWEEGKTGGGEWRDVEEVIYE